MKNTWKRETPKVAYPHFIRPTRTSRQLYSSSLRFYMAAVCLFIKAIFVKSNLGRSSFTSQGGEMHGNQRVLRSSSSLSNTLFSYADLRKAWRTSRNFIQWILGAHWRYTFYDIIIYYLFLAHQTQSGFDLADLFADVLLKSSTPSSVTLLRKIEKVC